MPRTPESDDEAALRWDEFDDPSYVESDAAAGARALSNTDETTNADDDVEGRSFDEPDASFPAAGTVSTPSVPAKLLTAFFALVYLAYSVGWVIGVGLVPLAGPTLLIEVVYQFSEFLAIVASALWFGAVMALTRDGRTVDRFGWLALGTLVLIPWPIVLGVLP